jgi:hypothetical protein
MRRQHSPTTSCGSPPATSSLSSLRKVGGNILEHLKKTFSSFIGSLLKDEGRECSAGVLQFGEV